MPWKTRGTHVRRNADGITEIFRPGDTINPTPFELAQFQNKFYREVDEVNTVVEIELNYNDLESAKTAATALMAAPPTGVTISEKNKKKLNNYISQKPTKQENIDKLTIAINELVGKIATPEAKEEGDE